MVLGLGSWEIVLVGLALLVLFGPEHAPQAIRKAGQLQARVERALSQLERAAELEEEESLEDESLNSSRDGLPASDDEDETD